MKNKPVCVGDWLSFARQFLGELPNPNFERSAQEVSLETQVLAGYALDKPRAWVLAHPEVILTPQQQRQLTRLLGGLAQGTPLPYLTGRQEFYGLEFEVSPDVLIPRPETELLVERGLAWLQAHPDRRCAADVGTGSGCIAVSLAHHVPDLRVLATDRSLAALQVARKNAWRHAAAGRVAFLQADLLSAAAGPFDLVCANLPYIPAESLSSLRVTRYEPRQALDGGPDGLRAIRTLLADSPRWLAPAGLLLLEMQYDQGKAIASLAREYLPGSHVSIQNDLANLPRLVKIDLGA
jgi:release factor glutamine methyltransferase